MCLGDVAALEVASIALRQFEHFPQTTDAPRAVATVALVVAVTETVLLLGLFYQLQYFWNVKELTSSLLQNEKLIFR